MNAQSTIRHAYDSVFEGQTNLSMGERIVSTGLGLAVAAGGLRKGAALVARGMSGHCPMKERLYGGHQDSLGHHGSHGSADAGSDRMSRSHMAESY